MRWIMLRLLICLIGLLPTGAEAADDLDVEVVVRVEGNAVRVDVDFLVQATPREAWEVLTDFSHMPTFISNLTTSKVLSHDANLVTVEQKGKASLGPMSFEFNSIREIRLSPFELIRTRQLDGNLRKFEGSTELSVENGQTRIHHHSDSISNVWIPPLLGRRFIASETREQFSELRREILRRKQSAEKSSGR